MKKKIISIIGVAIIGIVFIWFILPRFQGNGQLTVTISPDSEIKENISAYLSVDKYSKEYILPFSVSLKAGQYDLFTTAVEGVPIHTKFKVQQSKTETLSVKMSRTGEQEQSEITPSTDELNNNPLLQLFPYYDPDFEVSAEFSRDAKGEIIVSKMIVVIHAAQGQNETSQDYLQKKQDYTNEAKAWIASQKLSADIPVQFQ